jgi:hypothetical protein
VLAYLFWHTPRTDDTARYDDGLAAFHRALAADPPAGFVRSWTLAVERPAWLPDGPAHYLDWYLVDGFPALGTLNDAAIGGTRRAPHDAVAALARTGTAGLVALEAGAADVPAQPVLALLDKPAGEPYRTFRAALAAGVTASTGTGGWMRQMTLGPGPEFVVLGGAGQLPSLPWPITTMTARLAAG